jgi:hypothetical protein
MSAIGEKLAWILAPTDVGGDESCEGGIVQSM